MPGVDDLDPGFLLCRDLRHQWEPGKIEKAEDRIVWRTCVCLRCGTERVEVVDLDQWRVVSRYYNHPIGYLAPGVRFAEFRQASLRRQLRKAGIKEVRP